MIDVTNEKRRVAIIGGGITGLTTAYYLQQEAKQKKLPIDIILLEASHRFGGRIQTVNEDGYQIEKGPSSFTDHRGTMAELAQSLGIESLLVRSKKGQKYVAINEELYAVPKGVQFGIPTEMKPFMASDVVSWSGKARATLDFLYPQGKLTGDRSLGIWMRKRLGGEVVENITEPLLSGIYNGDIDQLSLEAVLPFLNKYSTSSKGLISGVRAYTQASEFLIDHQANFSFLGGLTVLTDEIVKQLTEVELKRGIRVTSIEKHEQRLLLKLNDYSTIEADSVVIAGPHSVAQSLIKEKELLAELNNIPLNTVATVSMAFEEANMPATFPGTSFVVSRNNDVSITLANVMNRKWDHVAPAGKALMKVHVGRIGDESVVDLSDKEIEKVVLQDLHRLIGLTGTPEKVVVTRHKQSMPQYLIGHVERIRSIKEQLATIYPTVHLAGNSYEGISIPKCVRQSKKIVETIVKELF